MNVDKLRVLRVVRSGVWLCAEVIGQGDLPGTVTVRGRRAHQWQGAVDCSALALAGPSGGRITAETTVDLRTDDIIESHRMTSTAVARVAAIKAP